MDNTIEGKEVDPHLLTIVENPHLVPVEMMPFVQGVGHKDLVGYVDGYISKFEAVFVVERIRGLICNILNEELGKVLPNAGVQLQSRKIKALGGDVFLLRGLDDGMSILKDECEVHMEREGENFINDDLAIAASGYSFTDVSRNQHRTSGHNVLLDTDGQWIKRFLGEKRAEGRRLIALRQEEDGRIVLGNNSKRNECKIFAGGFPYDGNFLKVSDIAKKDDLDSMRFSDVMAVILRIHNLLYAVHKTCIGEEGLPDGRTKWELPKEYYV